MILLVIKNSLKLIPYSGSKENIILFAANLRKDKNPIALAKFLKSLNMANWKIIVIGRLNGYKQLFNDINEKVLFLGEKSYEDTLQWFQRSKVLINTSIQEGFTNTFIQAWYYNVWIESLTVDPDMIISEAGYGKVHQGNLDGLILSVQQYIDGKKINTQKLHEAKQYVEEAHDLKKNINKLNKLFIEY